MDKHCHTVHEAVTLEDMLSARDRRRETQEALLKKHGQTLVSYTLNIAGPQKRYSLADRCFFEGKTLIERRNRPQIFFRRNTILCQHG